MSFVSRLLDPALVERLNHLQLSARSVAEGTTTGLHKSPVKGASIEFRQHRFYVPGDEPRHLDWRVLARTDRPYVREYDEETNLRAMLLLDTSGSMAYSRRHGRKFDYAARLVASLAYLMLGQTESVGLGLLGEGLRHWIPPHGGTAQLSRIVDALERTQPAGPSALTGALHAAADRLDRRSLIILVSDLFVPAGLLREGLAHLRHDRHEVLVVQVLDGDEIDFPFSRWSRFRGLEDEPAQLCEPALVKKVYQENFRRHAQALREACRARAIELHVLRTDRPLLDALTTLLRRRRK